MHSSGLSQLLEEPLTVEVEGNQIGRAGREANSLATLLYDVNDAEARLQELQQQRPAIFRPQAMSTTSPAGCPLSERVPLFVIGAPSRLYHVQHTAEICRGRGFPTIYWLRTPEACELDRITPDAKKRCMVYWLTTVAPALQEFWTRLGGTMAMVVEDTSMPREDVKYADFLKASEDYETKNMGLRALRCFVS